MKQSGDSSDAEGDAETVTVCQRDVYEMQNVWETFDVTSAVRYWLANPDEPQVLQVSLRRATGRESLSGWAPGALGGSRACLFGLVLFCFRAFRKVWELAVKHMVIYKVVLVLMAWAFVGSGFFSFFFFFFSRQSGKFSVYLCYCGSFSFHLYVSFCFCLYKVVSLLMILCFF